MTIGPLDPDNSEAVIDFLNELLALDRDAIMRLMDYRTPCNAALAEHPTVQVVGREDWRVGLLGILNGLLGTRDESEARSGWGHITAVYDDDDVLTHFRKTDS